MELEMVMLEALFMARMTQSTIESNIQGHGKTLGMMNSSSFASIASSLAAVLPSPSPLTSSPSPSPSPSSSSSSSLSSSSSCKSSSSSEAYACFQPSADTRELETTLVIAAPAATKRALRESGMWEMRKMVTPPVETEMVAREEKLCSRVSSPDCHIKS